MAWIKLFEDYEEIKARFEDKTPILIKVREQKVCLVFYESEIFAFDDRCPHNGAQLHRGKCNNSMEIVCPLHFYQFNLKSGRESLGTRFELNTYPLKVDKTALFIRLKD
jgi:nitrite reductase/ring-hydroxylating ferredoxin subunit